jgi:formylglycine-generating enzyme required for sulfatase activity
VASPSGGFCIDSTEVTRGQYGEFLDATAGDASFLDNGNGGPGFPPMCVPFSTLVSGVAPVPDDQNQPIRGVDWCAAYAYCTWAGKHLCGGAPSMDGGRASEWFAACSNDGRQDYPYGLVADASACNVALGAPANVGTFPACTGGYEGLFDMVGNIEEWVDYCTASSCARAGGGFGTGGGSSCAERDVASPKDPESNTGVRCCR